jgi:hypothetical protein
MDKRRKLTGAGAASIAVIATLGGVPAASASSVCAQCVPQGGSPPAFLKIADKFQKEATGIFLKIETAFTKGFKFPSEFLKIGTIKWGAPGNVFLKIK